MNHEDIPEDNPTDEVLCEIVKEHDPYPYPSKGNTDWLGVAVVVIAVILILYWIFG